MERKVALITGASRGLGQEIARVFAKNNADVIINYKENKEKAEHLAEELEEKYHITALPIQCDVSKEEEVKEMIAKIKEKFTHLDTIVNNAGIACDSLFLDKEKEDFLKVYETNLIGPFLVSKYGVHLMEEGSIINITSTNGIDTNYPYSADYDASKAALISLTDNLAVELAPKIRVNAVAPGWIDTEMNQELGEEYKKEEEKKILLKRFANPIEIAEVVYFLSTNKASYINKSVIRVDGGFYE